jgi:hypothetical protein
MTHTEVGRRRSCKAPCAPAPLLGAALAVALSVVARPAAAETRGYVISWFATATYIRDFKENCPEDRNKGRTELDIRRLIEIGYTREQATKIVGTGTVTLPAQYEQRIATNATETNGRHVSIYNYPDATKDPNIETVSGRYAYGFDLGGSNPAAKFEDPETHQKVDNQLWRAVGCTESFNKVPPGKPYPEELSWNLMIDSAPAWTMQISGADLSKDGPVTVTLDRATQHLERDANGDVEADGTYIIEPHSSSHNLLHGQIKDGVLTITPANLYLQGELPFYFEIALRNAHMRIEAGPQGRLVGYWGGYLNWRNYMYMYTSRPPNGADSIGLFWAVKKMADSNPDPKTGENRDISGTFRMEALPAYLAQPDGKIVALPAHDSGALREVAGLDETAVKLTN